MVEVCLNAANMLDWNNRRYSARRPEWRPGASAQNQSGIVYLMAVDTVISTISLLSSL